MVVINPAAKLINLTRESPDPEKVRFDTEIEAVDCNLNTDLTEGRSIYKGDIKQQDGTKTYSILRVEAKDGGLIISGRPFGTIEQTCNVRRKVGTNQ